MKSSKYSEAFIKEKDNSDGTTDLACRIYSREASYTRYFFFVYIFPTS